MTHLRQASILARAAGVGIAAFPTFAVLYEPHIEPRGQPLPEWISSAGDAAPPPPPDDAASAASGAAPPAPPDAACTAAPFFAFRGLWAGAKHLRPSQWKGVSLCWLQSLQRTRSHTLSSSGPMRVIATMPSNFLFSDFCWASSNVDALQMGQVTMPFRWRPCRQ